MTHQPRASISDTHTWGMGGVFGEGDKSVYVCVCVCVCVCVRVCIGVRERGRQSERERRVWPGGINTALPEAKPCH